VLQDGTRIYGEGFGYPCRVIGEVVFNTGMVGYTESMSDPSYCGQILCFTYPLIGNYGVPSYDSRDEFNFPIFFESEKIQVSGVIVHELCEQPSHWRSVKSFDQWLYEEKVPGISGVDTRELTKKLRMYGVMMGALEVSEEEIDVDALEEELRSSRSYSEMNLVKNVTVDHPVIHENGDVRAVMIDCGVKYSIIRRLLDRRLTVVRLPYDADIEDVLSYKPDAIVISNGPGDPKACSKTIATVKEIVRTKLPILGICLGVQILTLALGGDTYKLKYGHRGQNKPCIEVETGRSYVTSQNHGYAVNPESLKSTGLEVWFVNSDDRTVEGVKHKDKPCLAVQFHPEAAPGPYDTSFVFDIFSKMVKK